MLNDVMVILAFGMMLFSPCLVALHASLAEEGTGLGYATTYFRLREWSVVTFFRMRAWSIATFRV